ncbi:MAG TPA: Gfo/Idh/MocA family oxidoreductase [Ktedonobacteraceae bacterium]|nr:Gfo/Idh/MocA family oxidoreductase [Ktedonobacteraceae bacterium]
MSNRVRIGIVGAGGISHMHEAGYTEIDDLCELAAFCDIDEELAHVRARPYQARVYTAYQDLLADPAIDMVDITVPHHLHHPIALAALEQGKHVLVEKPMAMTSAQAWDLIETAHRMDVRFTVAENTHFVAAYQEAERVLQAGTLGEIRFVRTCIAGSEAERIKNQASWVGSSENQGVLLDSGVHTFYLLKWLFGGITDIQAIAYRLLPESEVDDHVLAFGHLANGAVYASTQSCVIETPWTERLEIHGSTGSLIVDQLANPPAIYFHGSDDIDGTPLPEVPFEPLAWKYLSIVAEVQDFVQAIIEERAPRIDPLYGHYAIQVVEAAYQSIREGKSISL